MTNSNSCLCVFGGSRVKKIVIVLCSILALQLASLASPLDTKQIENTWQKIQKSAPEKEVFTHHLSKRGDISDVFVALQVDKNIEQVWDEIIAFHAYPKNIDELDEVTVYETNGSTVKVTLTFSKFFFTFDNSFIHKLDKPNYTLTWELDKTLPYEMLNLSYGIWRLEKMSENKTRAYYYNSVSHLSWIPNMIVEYALETGSRNSTVWLIE